MDPLGTHLLESVLVSTGLEVLAARPQRDLLVFPEECRVWLAQPGAAAAAEAAHGKGLGRTEPEEEQRERGNALCEG